MQRHKIDVMMIMETRISTTSNLNINGYLCYLVSNPNSYRRGGVAILVRHGIRPGSVGNYSYELHTMCVSRYLYVIRQQERNDLLLHETILQKYM